MDEQSLQMLVKTQAGATTENYAYEYIDTSSQVIEKGDCFVKLDSFTEEPDYLGKITIEGGLSA